MADLTASYDAGSRDEICLRWYATTLIATGAVDEARPIIDEWLLIEPGNTVAQQLHAMVISDNETQVEEGSPGVEADMGDLP